MGGGAVACSGAALGLRKECQQTMVAVMRQVVTKIVSARARISESRQALPMFFGAKTDSSRRATSLPTPLHAHQHPRYLNAYLRKALLRRRVDSWLSDQKCSTPSLYSPRLGRWLASGFPQISSGSFPRRTSCNQTSRAVSERSLIRGKCRWR